MIYVLIASCLGNLYLLIALWREFFKRTQLEESVMAIKLERDFERFMESRYTNEREPGGNLQ